MRVKKEKLFGVEGLLMADYKRLGNYVLFEKEFESSLFSSWRAGEVGQNEMQGHLRIDILAPDLSKNAKLAENWLGHSVSAAKLEHPNLLKEKTAVLEGSLVAIYPYQESYSLEQLFQKSISEGIPFSLDHALLIAGKLASALSYAASTHQPHALVLPIFINISAEGDLKIRGFAISHSLREHLSAYPELMAPYSRFFPQGDHLGDGSLDRYSSFAVGSILFEMLTGEPFYAAGKVADARMRVSESEAVSMDGPIPQGISDVLCKAIDPHFPKSYENVQSLNADLEKLLFSGEYSPTTFNLAFFMHSAFREAVEGRTEAMAAEKSLTFSTPEPVSIPGTQPSEMPPPVTQPQVSVAQNQAPKKSKAGLIGAVAGVLVIALIGIYFGFIKGDKQKVEDKQQAQKQAMMDKQKESKKASETLQDNRKDIEIQLLKEKLRKQMEDMEAENARLDEEMKQAEAQVDEKAKALAKKLEEERLAKEAEVAAMQAKIAEMEKERQAVLDAEAEKARLIAEADAKAKAEADAEAKALEDAQKAADARAQGYSAPMPVTEEENSNATAAPEQVRNGTLLPASAMDNAAQLEKAINAQNFYTPSRKALAAGILKSGHYYAYSFNVVIDEDGKTETCTIDQNPLAHLANDFGMKKRATDWAKRLRYKPPVKDGLPSKCTKLVLIHFRIL